MSSTLSLFLLTLVTQSRHGVDSDEAMIPVLVSDNAKMMRRTCSASYCSISSNDSDPDVAATEGAKKTEIKPTNWDRLCSPISESRSVQKTLSLPLRKLSNDNIASMTKNQPTQRSQSVSRLKKINSLFEIPPCSGRNACNALFAASLRRKPATTETSSTPLRRKVREDIMTSPRQNKSASTSTKNAILSIPLQGKINPFIALLPTSSKEKDLNRPLECPQRKPSVDTMLCMMKNRTSIPTPSNQANSSFDRESLKRHGKRALQNPFKCLVEFPTKEDSMLAKRIVTIEQDPMPISLLASKTNKLPLKSVLKTSSTGNHKTTRNYKTKSAVRMVSLTDQAFLAFQANMGNQQQQHQKDRFCKDDMARRLSQTVETLQKSIDIGDRSSGYVDSPGSSRLRSLIGKAA
jgi:hypothetical protein